MENESKKKVCAKCGILFWVDKHHILPKAIFKGEGEIVLLCPNCHRDYHEKLGRKNLKNPDTDFHYAFYRKWLAGGLAFVLLAAAWFFL